MRKIINKIRAQHLDPGQFFCHLIERFREILEFFRMFQVNLSHEVS